MKKLKLCPYVEENDYDGLLNCIAKRLRYFNTDNSDPDSAIIIRILSEFGLFLVKMNEHPFHEFRMRDEVYKMAQKIDAMIEHDIDASKAFIKVMAKISNYAFKVEFANKLGFEKIDDLDKYLDET